jgi:lipopolysaccharide biosynthesis glycosyltransferase
MIATVSSSASGSSTSGCAPEVVGHPTAAQTRSEVRHVAFAVNAPYLPWCATAISSCLSTNAHLPIAVHVLHDDSVLDEGLRAPLSAMAENAGGSIRFHHVDMSAIAEFPSLDRFGAVAWFRLLLPELLPDVDKLLYLDADTLVTDSIGALWDTPLGDAPMAAVANVVERPMWQHVKALGIDDPRRVFNTGVMLMDLASLREERLLEAVMKVVRDRRADLVWPDQDALNIVFADRWYGLHPRWNAQNSLWSWADLACGVFGSGTVAEATASPAILHFEGPSLCKPWHTLCQHPWRDEYWRHLRCTPWPDVEPEDNTMVTRLIARLPIQHQLPVYRVWYRWRRSLQRIKPSSLLEA